MIPPPTHTHIFAPPLHPCLSNTHCHRRYVDWLLPEDRVLVIGTSSLKSGLDGGDKDLNKVFDRKLYIPVPGYPHRLMVWKHTLQRVLGGNAAEELDVSMLANISNGFSPGAIVNAVESTLTTRRIQRLDKRMLTEDEFIGALSRQHRLHQDEHNKFVEVS